MSNNRTQELQDRIRSAINDKKMLSIVGGNSKHFYGNASADSRPLATNTSSQTEVIETRIHNGVISYEPSELVITVRAGTPLKDVEDILKENNQMLPFEPPHFGEHATIGGCVATGLSGPRRPFTGSVRDYVLGVKIISGKGEVMTFGGQVMKNVAGYDVSRLMVGALGTLGLILVVSIKVLPIPKFESTLCLGLSQQDALNKMHQIKQTSLPLSALAYENEKLYIRLSGAKSAVNSAQNKLGGDKVVHADNFWQQLNEQTHPFFDNSKSLWRLSVPYDSVIKTDETSFIDWAGALYWLHSDKNANEIQQIAAAQGGSASLFRVNKSGLEKHERFMPLAAKIRQLQLNLKMKFDPYGILNYGRLYSDL